MVNDFGEVSESACAAASSEQTVKLLVLMCFPAKPDYQQSIFISSVEC